MALPRQPTTMEDLPGEVLTDIFIRLLAKKVAQMRCISKSWNALLSESSFVKSHLHHSIHGNDEIFLFFENGFLLDHSPFTLRFSGSSHLELTNFIQPPVCSHSGNSFGRVIGSVNGLICFHSISNHDYVVHIWNPSISAMLTLPLYSLPSHDSSGFSFRFGFDPKTDDYKVVKLTSLFRPYRMAPQVEVYSMRKGSWELITSKFPSHAKMIIDSFEFCINGHDGHLYWLGYIDLEWKVQTIVAFDLGAETFHEIPLPDSIQNCQVYCPNVLGVLGGKLCVMSRVNDGNCEVWVMDEYGMAQSWVKHHAFSQFGHNRIPYGFTLHNEFLFKVVGDDFALYDPIADKANMLGIPGGGVGISKVVKYVDSLVWVSPAEHEM